MDDREGKFAFCQVFAHALVVAVLLGREVHVVVADLENEANQVDEGHAVSGSGGFSSHELDPQAEQTARLVADHLKIVLLGGTGEGVSPEEVHALTTVQIHELFGKDGDDLGIVESLQLLEGGKVNVVCRIDGLSDTKNVVGDGEATAQLGRILDIVNEERRLVEHADDASNDFEALWGNLKPGVEGRNQLGAKVLAGMADDIVVGGADDLFLVLCPGPLLCKVEVLMSVSLRVGGWAGGLHHANVGAGDGASRRALPLTKPAGLGDRAQDGLCGS